jgi:hypothetical protein
MLDNRWSQAVGGSVAWCSRYQHMRWCREISLGALDCRVQVMARLCEGGTSAHDVMNEGVRKVQSKSVW